MKIFKLSIIFLLIIMSSLFSQRSFLSYYELNDFLSTSPGAFKYGLYGFSNPAATTYLNGNDIMFTLSQQNDNLNYPSRWGVFTGNPKQSFLSTNMPSNGMGLIHTADSNFSIYDFRYSWGFGNRIFNFGMGFGYTFGDAKEFNRSSIVQFGGIIRPFRQLSFGIQHTLALEGTDAETVVELAIRPIGTYPLTFFADASMFNEQKIKKAMWSSGVSWEIVDGIRLNSRYFSDKSLVVGVDFSLGKMGFATQSHFNSNQEYGYNSYSIRVGATDRTIIDKISLADAYVKMNLKGSVNYLGFLWFDNSTQLLDLLEKIDIAKKSSSIKGLVINISGLSANMEMIWEIREKLKEFKSSGKKIVIFFDRVSLTGYQLASVADKIIMDPLGSISLNGYAMGRSYYKKMLDEFGIGFEELRYFKYKSAYESFGRNNMSEGDREQRQKLIDDWYEISRDDICQERNYTHEKFDSLVNGSILYDKDKAITEGLIDTVGRWTDVKDIMKAIDDVPLWSANTLWKKNPPADDQWGEPLKSIAVVYALGACAMDNGIKARSLSAYLKKIAENDNISAIVLRVDSPGGDGMASDYVAEIIREFKGKKPIIVTQGAVAASGGYWLSMDADTIVAAPMTITGSIGVIGAWFYNKGLADSLGISTEILKRGKYADLGYPFTFPLIPIGLPLRNLNEDEKSQMEKHIKKYYKDFVTMVANGRGVEYDEIHKVAQGRIWSGKEGKKIGLVDVLGGLDKAIKIAKEKAGLDLDDEVRIIEYPKQELFDLGMLFSTTLGIDIKDTKEKLEMLKFRIDNNGMPMPMIPLDYFEYVQEE